MNITDAYLVHPFAMGHARQVIAGEMDMLHRGIGKKKRIEWLASLRDQLCIDAALVIPTHLAPLIESMSTKATIVLLGEIGRSLTSINAGTTIRDLRNAQHRMGLPGYVLDPITMNGAMLLLVEDEDFIAAMKRAFTPLMNHLESSKEFRDAEGPYSEIMASDDLETSKQRRVTELAMQTLPSILVGMPDIIDSTVRDIAYIYGRLLDQEIMPSITMCVKELGAGIFDQLSSAIISESIEAYRVVLTELINDRITELSDDDHRHQPAEIKQKDASIPQPAAPLVDQHPELDAQPMPELLSIIETAKYLRVTRGTIYRLLKSGALAGTYVGRKHLVTRASIVKYLAV